MASSGLRKRPAGGPPGAPAAKRWFADPISVGIEWSGAATVAWALRILQVPHKLEFCNDPRASAQAVAHFLQTKQILAEMLLEERDVQAMPRVDLYVCSPQHDPRFKHLPVYVAPYLEYIKIHKPEVVMFELPMSYRIPPHRAYLSAIKAEMNLTKDYFIEEQTLDGKDWGLPTERRSFFVIGIRNKDDYVEMFWPDKPPRPERKLGAFISKIPGHGFRYFPDPMRHGQKALDTVLHHIDVHRMRSCLNPFKDTLVIKTAGERTQAYTERIEFRGAEARLLGLWCTTKGGFMSAADVGKVMGFAEGLVPWQALDIQEGGMAQLFVESAPLPIVLAMMPNILCAINRLLGRPLEQVRAKAALYDVLEPWD